MAVDSISIEEIKTLTDKYNVILEQYIAANKSLSSLGVYEVLSKKKISGGIPSYSGTSVTVEACQAKCADLNCSAVAYNSDTKLCQINNTGEIIDGTLSDRVIINKQIYYLNKLDNLNTQLSTINSQIIAKINTINTSGTLTSLRDDRVRLNAKLDVDKAYLTEQMAGTSTNSMYNSNILDLEYIQRDEELETNSRYYIFLLLVFIFIIALAVLIGIQT
jgi:hypothetical protein